MNSMTKSTRAAAVAVTSVALAWSPVVHSADLNTEMQSMFNQIGAMGSATGASAYRGQAMNLYMGGDIQMRTPIRTYQLYSYVLPSIRGSCGGIDSFLGSFSHINTAQFKQLLQQIANNTVGLLFQAALSSIQPLIASKIEWLQNTLQLANNSTINSCNIAKQFVGGLAGMAGINTFDNCQSVRDFYGWDSAEAQRVCRTDPLGPQQGAAADPIFAKLTERDVNLMWAALRNLSIFSVEEKETFINLAGSAIVYKTTASGEKPMSKLIEPLNDDAFALLIGNAPASSPDKVKLAWWKCQDLTTDPECINMTVDTKDVTPFTVLVENQLTAIRDKLSAAAAPLSPTEINFINTTSLPVWKMLTLGYSAPDPVLSDLLIQKYKTVIAYDYAHLFLRRALKEARFYLGQANVRNAIEEKYLDGLLDGLTKRANLLQQQYVAAHQALRDMNSFTDDLQSLERSLMTTIPFRLKSTLDFTKALNSSSR